MKRILIVDDDRDIREMMTMLLEGEGYEVSTLDRGKHAIETVLSIQPDLVLLDVMLGDSDGRYICRAIKSNDATQSIPVLLVSATYERHAPDYDHWLADGFINKPFDIDVLTNAVKAYIN